MYFLSSSLSLFEESIPGSTDSDPQLKMCPTSLLKLQGIIGRRLPRLSVEGRYRLTRE